MPASGGWCTSSTRAGAEPAHGVGQLVAHAAPDEHGVRVRAGHLDARGGLGRAVRAVRAGGRAGRVVVHDIDCRTGPPTGSAGRPTHLGIRQGRDLPAFRGARPVERIVGADGIGRGGAGDHADRLQNRTRHLVGAAP